MKKVGMFILGGLLIAFGIAQVLQLMGLIGVKAFSIAGVALALLGFALGAACFQQALKKN